MLGGYKVEIEGAEYVIPPLSLGMLRNGMLATLQEHDRLLAEGKTWEAFDVRGKIVFACLKRNYPDFDETKLFNFLDLGNLSQIWSGVLGLSGFVPGEVKAESSGISNPSTAA